MQVKLYRFNEPCSFPTEKVIGKDNPASPRDIAKSALERFYDFDKASFKPKPRFERNAPEEAVVFDRDGRKLGTYSIRDIVADRRVYLTAD